MQAAGSFLTQLLNPFTDTRGSTGSFGPATGFAAESRLSPEAASAYAAVTPKAGARRDAGKRWGIWGAAYDGTASINGNSNSGSHTTDTRTYGFAAGLDYYFTNDIMGGFALSGGETSWSLSQGLGGGRSNMLQAGLYGSTHLGPAYLSGALAYAWHEATTDRTITVSGTDKLAANFNANSFSGRLDGGYRFALQSYGLTPYGAVQTSIFHTPAYSEHAGLGSSQFALSYEAHTTTATRTELGAWIDKSFPWPMAAALLLRSRAAWAHNFETSSRFNAAFQTLPGSSFTVNGAASPDDAALVSVSDELKLSHGVSFSGRLGCELSSQSQSYAGIAAMWYQW